MVRKILSLDGGGIRGASTATFLNQLEKASGKPLHQIFSLIAGTSTGGIIAAAIGILKMPGDNLVNLYDHENGKEIFPQSFWDQTLPIQNQPKYDGKGKRNMLKKYFGKRLLKSSKMPLILTAYDVENRIPVILKSTDKDKTKALDAVDATSAAPTFFPTVQVNNQWLIDGGVIVNNPTMTAYAEAKKLWPDDEIRVFSVGTGKRTRRIPGEESQDYGAIGWLTHDLIGIVTDETIVDMQAETILGDNYIRVNSNLDLADDDIDNIKQGNITNLRNLGEEWWTKFGSDTFTLLSK